MTSFAALAVPGSLDSRTGGYIYDRRVVHGLRARGWTIEVIQLDDAVAESSAAALSAAEMAFASLPRGAVTLVDSLALAAIADTVQRHARRLRIVALMHLPRAADIGLDPSTAERIALDERRALAAVALVIVTGRATLTLLALDEGAGKVVVIEPGTDPAPLARGSQNSCLELLSVAAITPGKGHEDLLSALAALPARDWRLTCAGSLTRHPSTAARVRTRVRELGLDERVVFTGELGEDEIAELYDACDLFVLATHRETYGMVVAEALARGIPVISTTTGAIPDLTGDDAGLLVEPGDVEGLTAALGRAMTDADLRARLAAGARRRRASLPRWDETIDKMAAALESVAHD